jgi:hypothetical protein
MFVAYMQKANNFFFLNLHFCFEPQVCVGSSSFRSCGVVPWRGRVSNIILQHSVTLPPHLTTNISLHTIGRTHPTLLLLYHHGQRPLPYISS